MTKKRVYNDAYIIQLASLAKDASGRRSDISANEVSQPLRYSQIIK